MRIRSLGQLVELLDDELAWRKRELTTLKFMLQSTRRQHQESLLLRAAICILYAHWEGFVKAAATGYVSFVATRNLKYSDLTPNFVALGLRSEIIRAGQSDKPTLHTKLAARFMMGLSDSMYIDRNFSVDTRSNLNSDNLNEILCLLGVENDEYLLKKQLLDKGLVENRNRVAHGQQIDIDPDDYTGLHDEMIQLVQNIRTDIENQAVMEGFRRDLS